MLKKDFKNKLIAFIHKFTRFTKQQKTFVLYLFGLAFLLLFFPVIKITPNDIALSPDRIWLLNWNFFTTTLIIFISLATLIWWNVSFKFKNIIINYFGFKENDSLVNFAFLWIILTAFFAIGNTVWVVNNQTSTISLPFFGYYITWIYLLVWLILTVLSVIKNAKDHSSKTKIINVIDNDTLKEISNKKSFQWLFDQKDWE